MNYLYEFNKELKTGKNYIYGDGKHATHMGRYFKIRGILFEGFCTIHRRRENLMGKKVIEIDEFNELENANLLITQSKWQNVYDELYSLIPKEKIYVNTTWIKEDNACIICNNPITFSGSACFVPFLKERMFNNEDRETEIIHCPKCRASYSSYRPSDVEMDLLYTGYRDEIYQKTREKYEIAYTKEFNEHLISLANGGGKRRQNISQFLVPVINKETINYVLDFGGDKGQFIPQDILCTETKKFVYEISGSEVIDGVTLLTEKEDLKLYQWDLILCNMVLEHLSDVRSYFKDLVSYMGESAFLYIEVPNENRSEEHTSELQSH